MTPWLFWLCVVLMGIWTQQFLPGMDALAPGVIVCLEREPPARSVWVLAAVLLVQEGLGSLAFGTCLVLYAGLLAAYFGARDVFQRGSMSFACLLGVLYAALTAVGAVLMAGLQDAVVDADGLARRAVAQAAVFVTAWAFCYAAHRRLVRHESRSP